MKRFIDNKDGTIIDRKNNLMWEKHGSDEPIIFEKVIEYPNYYNSNGNLSQRNWRLPTVKELQSLFYDSNNIGEAISRIIHPIFDAHLEEYWSSTIDSINDAIAWVVNFGGDGKETSHCKKRKFYVRCVRDLTEKEKADLIIKDGIDGYDPSNLLRKTPYLDETIKRDFEASHEDMCLICGNRNTKLCDYCNINPEQINKNIAISDKDRQALNVFSKWRSVIKPTDNKDQIPDHVPCKLCGHTTGDNGDCSNPDCKNWNGEIPIELVFKENDQEKFIDDLLKKNDVENLLEYTSIIKKIMDTCIEYGEKKVSENRVQCSSCKAQCYSGHICLNPNCDGMIK